MEKKTTVTCEYCGKEAVKASKEVTRSIKLGRRLFCNNSCGAKFGNRPRKNPKIIKSCLYCGAPFETKTGAKESSFCSRECASSGSYTEARREASRKGGYATFKENLLTASAALKLREAWKYTELEERLKGVQHEFEFLLGKSVYDLALLGAKMLIEFDGKYHTDSKQRLRDKEKDQLAEACGYSIVRIKTDDTKVIPSSVLDEVLQAMNV